MGRIRAWLLYAVGLVVVMLMVWDLLFSNHGYVVFRQEQQELRHLREELKQLKAEQARLQAEIIRLREDPRTLEEVIRRELGYVYPDEYMLIMPEDDAPQPPAKHKEDKP